MAKAPTASGVSAALRKAGFERSGKRKTRIRGHYGFSAGYLVSAGEPGEVNVGHATGFAASADLDGRREAKLAEYAEALRAKGWNVQTMPSAIPRLLVTELGEDAATATGEGNE